MTQLKPPPENPGRFKLYPRSWDFVDVFGSKHHNHVWDDDFSIHLHSIYLIRNEIAEKFEGLMAGQFNEILWHPKLSGVRRVHGETIGSEPDDLGNVIEYAGKFAMGIDPLRQRDDLPLSFQFPITGEERLLKRHDAQALAAA